MPEMMRARLNPSYRLIAAAALAASVAACSSLDLGPVPSNYVGASRNQGAVELTDTGLEAVRPQVPGDRPGGAAMLPGVTTTAPGNAPNPATLPAATEPTTTQPAAASAGTQPETQPSLGKGGTPATAPADIPQALSVQDAILTGLQNNISLRVQRYEVPISRTNEERNRAAFDPTVNFSLQGQRVQRGTVVSTPVTNGTVSSFITGPGVGIVDSINGNLSVTELLPTGTSITAGITTSNSFYSEASSSLGPTITVTQALLRGGGLDVNLAALRQAEVNTRISQYVLRSAAESQVATIEQTYWDLAFAERQVVIVQNTLDVAQKQLDDTSTRVRVGQLSPSELPAAQAEVASQRENLINARSSLETTRLHFMQLITPAKRDFWNRTVTLTTLPFIPPGKMDPVDRHVEVALRLRPEINEAKLQIQSGDLVIVQTKNGLLPQLDMFVTLGKTAPSSRFGDSFSNLNGPDFNAVVGISGNLSPVNRSAQASYRAAQLRRDQLEETLDNQAQIVQFDVRSQYIEAERTRLQIDASRATREAREADLQVQQGKLAAGNGTSLAVAIAQRDLLNAQLTEVQSVTNHLKALVVLYQVEGSLLLRRGLEAPGSTPVDKIVWH